MASPWIQDANLGVCAGMEATATVTTDMLFICSNVSNEGQVEPNHLYSFATSNHNTSLSNGVRTHVQTIRPKALYNGKQNRTKFGLDSVELLVVGNYPIYYEVCVGQAITSPTWVDNNTTYSAYEHDHNGTLSGDPAIVIASGYVAATNNTSFSISKSVQNQYPITLNCDGTHRDLGQITITATSLGGASEIYSSIAYTEER